MLVATLADIALTAVRVVSLAVVDSFAPAWVCSTPRNPAITTTIARVTAILGLRGSETFLGRVPLPDPGLVAGGRSRFAHAKK